MSQVGIVSEDSPHLPHGHLAVVGVGVVVPLDGGQVGVEGEVDGGHQPLLRLAPQTRRDGQVAQLVHHLASVIYQQYRAANEPSRSFTITERALRILTNQTNHRL